MASRRSKLGVVLFGVVVAAIALAFGGPMADVHTPGPPPATVTFVDSDGETLGTVQAHVADDPQERFTGLSDTDSMAADEGMVFVFEREDDRAFVMRDMDFPLDIVFVGADGHITEIAHAPVENDTPLTRYEGRAKWVVEVNRGWTEEHGVSEGDEVRIDRT